MSKDEVVINQDHAEAIKGLPLLVNKKGVQSFLEKINFISGFILDFVGMIRPINFIQNKDQPFK